MENPIFHKYLEFDLNRQKTIDRAILQALLLTDGSVLPARNQISFANTSNTLIKQFCDLMFRVYGYQIKKIYNGKSTKQPVHMVQLKSKSICADLLSDLPNYKTAPDKNGQYIETKLPDIWLKFGIEEIGAVLRALFDADGGCSFRISERKKRKCIEAERTLFLSCRHSGLRKQYMQLLVNLDIMSGESSEKVVITGKGNFEKFRNLINFSEDVLIGYDSKHWQGIEKRKLLDILINSYDIPYGFLQKFEKRQVYSLLRSPSR